MNQESQKDINSATPAGMNTASPSSASSIPANQTLKQSSRPLTASSLIVKTKPKPFAVTRLVSKPSINKFLKPAKPKDGSTTPSMPDITWEELMQLDMEDFESRSKPKEEAPLEIKPPDPPVEDKGMDVAGDVDGVPMPPRSMVELDGSPFVSSSPAFEVGGSRMEDEESALEKEKTPLFETSTEMASNDLPSLTLPENTPSLGEKVSETADSDPPAVHDSETLPVPEEVEVPMEDIVYSTKRKLETEETGGQENLSKRPKTIDYGDTDGIIIDPPDQPLLPVADTQILPQDAQDQISAHEDHVPDSSSMPPIQQSHDRPEPTAKIASPTRAESPLKSDPPLSCATPTFPINTSPSILPGSPTLPIRKSTTPLESRIEILPIPYVERLPSAAEIVSVARSVEEIVRDILRPLVIKAILVQRPDLDPLLAAQAFEDIPINELSEVTPVMRQVAQELSAAGLTSAQFDEAMHATSTLSLPLNPLRNDSPSVLPLGVSLMAPEMGKVLEIHIEVEAGHERGAMNVNEPSLEAGEEIVTKLSSDIQSSSLLGLSGVASRADKSPAPSDMSCDTQQTTGGEIEMQIDPPRDLSVVKEVSPPPNPLHDDEDLVMSAQEEEIYAKSPLKDVEPLLVQPLGSQICSTMKFTFDLRPEWFTAVQEPMSLQRTLCLASIRFEVLCYKTNEGQDFLGWPPPTVPLTVSLNNETPIHCNPPALYRQADAEPLCVSSLMRPGVNDITISHLGGLSEWSILLRAVPVQFSLTNPNFPTDIWPSLSKDLALMNEEPLPLLQFRDFETLPSAT